MLELLVDAFDALVPVVYAVLAAVTAGIGLEAGSMSLATVNHGGPTLLAAWFGYMGVLALVAGVKLASSAAAKTGIGAATTS
ncbi:hypothetical protein [Halocalculus aciditolerans]|uniref:DUF8151 domain-containing protein n=1 Tax=Halocalculus aciditolerans TaxID=1383812 RepID=A0A830FHM1_9EURY|nr:hypothetical protein [Halocalculus aciditolerans]GGL48198.1 hypothetical protein GCM10009039_03030 [Halocalculus aciditolerans]